MCTLGSCLSYLLVLLCVVSSASDDHGVSWTLGGFGQQGSRESQVVQTEGSSGREDAFLYITERNFGANPGHRLYARSNDSGTSFNITGDVPGLITPITAHWTGIVASIVRLTSSVEDRSRILYSCPEDPKARARLSLRLSYDEGHTWGSARVLFAGPAGYSDLVRLPEKEGAGIIFENGEDTFADRISFQTVPLSWIEGN